MEADPKLRLNKEQLDNSRLSLLQPASKKEVDEDLYPEHYRKSEYVKGNNYNTPDPFQVSHFLLLTSPMVYY
jgi:hypothetical protein